jgi:LCP family protein required for cell wall assembly
MSDDQRRRPAGDAYTGETIVMPKRQPAAQPEPGAPRAPAPRAPLRPRRSIWKTVRRVLLAVLALSLVALLLFYLQIRSVASKIVVADARPNAPISSPLAGGMNLLIVGVDERPGHPEEGVRGDTLIVVHLDALGRWTSLLSIPRDTRMTIPDAGETKINVAYGQGYAAAEALYGPGTTPQQGGMALAAQTVERFLGLRIDGVAQINFDGFAAVVDALGGVDIDVPVAIVDEEYPTPDFGTMRVEFQPGMQHMDGATALIYARTRHADSDFGRAERQQQVLRAIAAKLKARGVLGDALLAPRLLGGLEGAVKTTLPIARPDMLLGLGWIASGFDPAEMGQVRLSPETAPNYREEGSDLIWDPNDVRAVVDAFLTRPSEASEAASVQVLNGAGASGLAGQVTIELEQAGFMVIPADNAPADAEQTVVYDVTGKPRTAARLARQLGASVQPGAPDGVSSPADIVVVLGADAVSR